MHVEQKPIAVGHFGLLRWPEKEKQTKHWLSNTFYIKISKQLKSNIH
jgi:hypothetical protein